MLFPSPINAIFVSGKRSPRSCSVCELTRVDERKSRVVEMRFFGGLSVEETAAVLNVSVDTVMRDWKLARAWLLRELSRDH